MRGLVWRHKHEKHILSNTVTSVAISTVSSSNDFPLFEPPYWPSGKDIRLEQQTWIHFPLAPWLFCLVVPVATQPDSRCCRVNTGTGQPNVSILWLGEIENLVCNFCLSVAALTLVWADPSRRYISMLLGLLTTQQPTTTLTCCRPAIWAFADTDCSVPPTIPWWDHPGWSGDSCPSREVLL